MGTIIMGDGIADVFVPLIERDRTAAVFILFAVAIVYLGFSNLVLSVIVEKAEEARSQDTTYQAILAKKMKDQARKELLKLWEELDMDGSNTVTLMELTQQYELSESFREYFKSMDIDLPFLQYAFAVMDPDGDGSCSFQDFAETVVHLKSTDPGPTVAFVRHQMAQVVTDVSDIKHTLSNTRSKSHEIEVARDRVPLSSSAASGNPSTSHCHSPKLDPVHGDQQTQDLQDTLHELEAAFSQALEDGNTQSRLPCNAVEQPPVSICATAEPQKPTPPLRLPPWRCQDGSVAQSSQEDPHIAAEGMVQLLRYAYEGPRPMNLQHLHGLEYQFADLCQRVEVQLGQLLRLDSDAGARSRLELFACSARLMGVLGTAMPDMFPTSISSPQTSLAQQLHGHVQDNGHGNSDLRYIPMTRSWEL